MRDKVIYVNPQCFQNVSSQVVQDVLTDSKVMLETAQKAIELITDVERKYVTAGTEDIIDFDDYCDLEELVTEKFAITLDSVNKADNSGNILKKSYNYYNIAAEKIVEIFTVCIATKRDLVEVKSTLELVLGNLSSLMVNLFWDAISYNNFKYMISLGQEEEALVTYAAFDKDAALNIDTNIERWLKVNNLTIDMWCKYLLEVNNVYTVTSELYLRYPDKFRDFYNRISGSDIEDAIKDYSEFILPQDFDCIANGDIAIDEEYAQRLKDREDSHTSADLEMLISIYESNPAAYKYLYDNEEYIDVDWCLEVKAQGGINKTAMAIISNRKAEAKETSGKMPGSTGFFNSSN